MQSLAAAPNIKLAAFAAGIPLKVQGTMSRAPCGGAKHLVPCLIDGELGGGAAPHNG